MKINSELLFYRRFNMISSEINSFVHLIFISGLNLCLKMVVVYVVTLKRGDYTADFSWVKWDIIGSGLRKKNDKKIVFFQEKINVNIY